VDKALALTRLREYREQIPSFYNDVSPSQEFYRWRENVLILLEEILGKNSEEHREFDGIRFEVSPVRTSAVEEIIRRSVFPKAEIQAEYGQYFRERLHEAEETLLAITIGLSRRPK
jgi:hypothetical protein